MAGLTTSSKSNLAFKKLVGKAHTGNNIPFFSESIPSQISVDYSEVIGQVIPTDPNQAVNDGVAEYVECDVEEIAASNGLAYDIKFPSGYNGNISGASAGDLVRDHTQIIDQKNNLGDGPVKSDHSGGYVYDLRDGGSRVASGAVENWQVDPVAGIIVSEDPLDLGNDGKIRVYLFTGSFLDEVIQGGVSIGIGEDQVAFGNASDDVTGSSDFTFDGTKLTLNADQLIKQSLTVEGAFGFDSGTTVNEISEDTSLGGESASHDILPTQKAVKSYIDNRTELRETGQSVFDGNGTKKTFSSSHSLNITPGNWRVTPITEDASGFSHATADDQEIRFYYDFPPPSGTNNVALNWVIERDDSSVSSSFNTITFDGDGSSTEFAIPHGMSIAPAMWQVDALTDDGSGISHVTADSVNIYVHYDTPPPAGSNNVSLSWLTDSGTYSTLSDEDGGRQISSGDGIQVSFNIPHNLGTLPEFYLVTAVNDDSSGISHVTSNTSELIVHYDTPPPNGSNNLEFTWYATSTTFSGSSDEAGGQQTFGGDGSSFSFDIPHGLGGVPTVSLVTASDEDSGGISHVNSDSTNITVFYDTPPPIGINNLSINWYAKV